MFYAYILYSQGLQRYYVGSTQAVDKRIQENNSGKSTSTLARTPWKLIYTGSFTTRSEAVLRERKIKSRGIGRYLADIKHVSSG